MLLFPLADAIPYARTHASRMHQLRIALAYWPYAEREMSAMYVLASLFIADKGKWEWTHFDLKKKNEIS